MKRCGFCSDYKAVKEMKAILNRSSSTPERKLKTRYTARFVSETYVKYSDRDKWIYKGQSAKGSYTLRFCPSCGERL